MDSLDVIQVPTYSLLSSSSNNTPSGQSALPKTINKIVKKKLYKRTTTRTSPISSSLRRSSSSKSSSPYRNRRHKWRTIYHEDGAKPSLGDFFNRRKSRKSTDTTLSSTRSVVSPLVGTPKRSRKANSSTQGQISTPDRKSPHNPQSEQNLVIIESDDDDIENQITPSPIRDSPLYGRKSSQRDIGPSATTVTSSSSLYPRLPTGTSTNFVPYDPKPKDDSTIDSELIGKLREGPRGEVNNHELGQVYTAAMEGEDGHVKIGWTRDIDKRMAGLNSPKKYARISNVPDTTPGAQKRFLNSYHAEQIIHLELYSFRRIEVVRNQTEWFEMDMKQVQRVCRKWRNWLTQYDPYDENQELTEFWRNRLYQLEIYDAYDVSKHGCLHDRWNTFLNPSWWEKTSYEILTTWRIICKWWTWICKNYPIIVTLLGIVFWASNGVVSFLLCISLVLVVWAGVATAKEEDKRN